jgi:acylphosphatase
MGTAGASSDPTRLAARYRVSGRVQGVGFRAFVVRLGRRLGVVGEVCNLPDGSVEVKAAGGPEALAELARGLAQGPPGARVTSVAEAPLETVPAWTSFEVVYYRGGEGWTS